MDRTELALTIFLILTILIGFGLHGYQRQYGQVHPIVIDAGRKAHFPQNVAAFDKPLLQTQQEIPQSFGAPLKEKSRTLGDINRSTQSDLMLVPGIGKVTSARIIDYRNENGPFLRINDLQNVSGIGPSRLQDLKRYFRVPGEVSGPAEPAKGTSRAVLATAIPQNSSVGKVNINTVDAKTLADLVPGIGPALSGRIVQERTRLGGFTSMGQLKDINGIGEKRFEAIRKKVYLQ